MTPNPTTNWNPAKGLMHNPPVPAAKPDAVKMKILAVDDDPEISEALRKVLRMSSATRNR